MNALVLYASSKLEKKTFNCLKQILKIAFLRRLWLASQYNSDIVVKISLRRCHSIKYEEIITVKFIGFDKRLKSWIR